MDLQLYLRVIWRFKWLVAVGLVAAFSLSVLSMFQVSLKSPHLKSRSVEQWRSTQTLLVTPPGAPWLRVGNSANSDPQKFSTLGTILVQFVMSDEVRRLINRSWPLTKYDVIQAFPVLAQSYNSNSPPLPLISVEVTSFSGFRSRQLVEHTTAAFRDYVEQLQAQNSIPTDRRVVVTTVRSYEPPLLIAGRSKTLPVVIFLTVMIGISGICLVLENLRPRVRAVARDDAKLLRRSA
ncbi:MAG TPA: hypothetical protein VF963_07180 [Gaiellaceae bacterium]